MTTVRTVIPLDPKELAEYGAERIRNEAFDQILRLWEHRKAEGWTQKKLAEAIGRDPGWVSRNLSAPGNWTLRTIGAFVQGLEAEAFLNVYTLEDHAPRQNYDAYEGYTVRGEAEGLKRYVVEPPVETKNIFQSNPNRLEFA